MMLCIHFLSIMNVAYSRGNVESCGIWNMKWHQVECELGS